MAVASPDEFVSLVKRSGLITDDQLKHFLAQSCLPPEDPLAMAEALSQAGLVTSWQRDKLLDGRYKGFFLGKYKILDQLGAGAMGNVFLAEHLVMRHRVAIKTLAKRLLGNDAYVRRFEQEARAAAAVNHPRVVRAFDFDSDGDVYFLVMEYVEGEDLHKIVVRDGVLPIPIAAECIRQTADGLTAAHEAGLIHRDIKPSNLLVDKQGNVRILDLGLARLIDDTSPSLTLVTDSKMIGTVDYLAPEQARNSHHIDHRADLYSLGCTFYFLLTGRPPFDDGTLTQRVIEHQTRLPVDIRQWRKDCPAELAFICHKLLAKLPNERFQTAGEVSVALGEWLKIYAGALSGELDAAVTSRPSTALRKAASASRAGGSNVTDEDLAPAGETDTQHSLQASSSTASSRSAVKPGSAAKPGRPPAYDDLALADDSVLSSHVGLAASTSRGGSSSAGRGVNKTGSSAVSARGSGSGVTTGSQAGRTSGAAPIHALDLDSPASLPHQDSLVELLGAQMPDVLVPARPRPGANPLGISSDDLALSALNPQPEQRPTSAAEAFLRAAAESQARSPANWRERLESLVSEQGPGGIAYSLWFLIGAGMVLGLIICVVGYSYYESSKPANVNKTRATESREQ